MMHRHCFEAVDRAFRNVMKEVDKKNKNILFGGKVVVFGVDFRQILPVIPKGTRQEIVNVSLNSSYIWNYCEVLTLTKKYETLSGSSSADIEERRLFSDWVLAIGDGKIGQQNDMDISVHIPPELLIQSSGDHVASIMDITYPNLLESMHDISYFQNRVILAPKKLNS